MKTCSNKTIYKVFIYVISYFNVKNCIIKLYYFSTIGLLYILSFVDKSKYYIPFMLKISIYHL